MVAKRRPQIRLLFDEHVSPRVARALGALGCRVGYVGDEHQPPKGTEDADVLAHARTANQVVVTTNHDMIVLCAEEGESVIWLTPRDKDLTLEAVAAMCFAQLREWESLLAQANGPVCVMAHKTKCDVIPLERAKRIALERGKRRRRRRRSQGGQRSRGDLLDTATDG